MPAIIHIRASAAGLLATRKYPGPDWYIAMDSGATLSHHHAVGTEHARWLEQDVSPAGVAMLRGLFHGADPGRNLNPGKIVDVERAEADV